MQGSLGHPAWRWLFWIEGAVTMGVAISGKSPIVIIDDQRARMLTGFSRFHPPRFAYQL